jgi:hypothetical protein
MTKGSYEPGVSHGREDAMHYPLRDCVPSDATSPPTREQCWADFWALAAPRLAEMHSRGELASQLRQRPRGDEDAK